MKSATSSMVRRWFMALKRDNMYIYIYNNVHVAKKKMNAVRVPIRVHKYVTSVYVPFHTLNIDFIGHFPDKSYVSVIIGAFTR